MDMNALISKLGKKEIMKHYKVPAKDIKVIYNGVDLKKFKVPSPQLKLEVRKEFGFTKDDFILLFVGSGWERKGVKFLLQAFSLLENEKVKLLIVGKGKVRSYMKYISPEKKDKVIFTGIIEEREKVYKCADVFVFPTIYEPFGNVHLEAWASGLPVITTSRSGAAELIKHKKNGFVVERPEDIDSIKRYIEKLYDENYRNEVSKEARKLAEGFSLARNTDEFIKLYEEVLQEKRGR